MTGIAVRVTALAGVYLLVLTSASPGDIGVGVALALLFIGLRGRRYPRPEAGWLRWTSATVRTVTSTGWEMVLGVGRTVRFCLGAPAHPGLVEVPRAGRSELAVALWGVLTGEAPDEYPVDVDDERQMLIVHTLDASDPEAVRERHARAWHGWQRDVIP